MEIKDIIVKPVMTEKSMIDAAAGRYTFLVNKKADKAEIAKAIQKIFSVKVLKIHTIMVHGKVKKVPKTKLYTKKSDFKKAMVLLEKGQKIELFEVKAAQGAK